MQSEFVSDLEEPVERRPESRPQPRIQKHGLEDSRRSELGQRRERRRPGRARRDTAQLLARDMPEGMPPVEGVTEVQVEGEVHAEPAGRGHQTRNAHAAAAHRVYVEAECEGVQRNAPTSWTR